MTRYRTESHRPVTQAREEEGPSQWRQRAGACVRQRQLSEDVYRYVFELLDNEPDMTGDDAGKIANHVQREFERKYGAVMGVGR